MIEIKPSALKEIRPHEYLLRFVFGGLCTVIAGVIAQKFGPAIGGLFLAFPAIFPSGASLIESHEREKKRAVGSDGTRRGRMAAGSDAAGAALGCVGLCLFGVTAWQLLPRLNTVAAVGIASAVWVVVAPFLWKVRKQRFFTRTHSRRHHA